MAEKENSFPEVLLPIKNLMDLDKTELPKGSFERERRRILLKTLVQAYKFAVELDDKSLGETRYTEFMALSPDFFTEEQLASIENVVRIVDEAIFGKKD